MTHPYRSKDGLMTSSDPEVVRLWDEIGARQKSEQAHWNAVLRGLGVKMAHPDDGWVVSPGPVRNPPREERGDGSIRPSYPAFNDGVAVGDLIALGAPYQYEPHWNYRLCRVTAVERDHGILSLATKYTFTDTGQRLPEPPPPLPWWRRILNRKAHS